MIMNGRMTLKQSSVWPLNIVQHYTSSISYYSKDVKTIYNIGLMSTLNYTKSDNMTETYRLKTSIKLQI